MGGFTVVEMITVIALLAILSVGTTRFLTDASAGYAATERRATLVDNAQRSLLRLSREVQRALPASLRVSGDGRCLEMIEILAASAYVQAPVGSAGDGVHLLPLDNYDTLDEVRVAIQPDRGLYGLVSPGSISPPTGDVQILADNQHYLPFTSSHAFNENSSQRRAYLVRNPISFCFDADALWLYQGYGYTTTQPGVTSLPTNLPNRSLQAEGLGGASGFQAAAASLTRNGQIQVVLDLQMGTDQLTLSRVISVPNLP
ncbi:MAG: hypothetical protein AAF529_05910 [Pseudomonadota bacterium]